MTTHSSQSSAPTEFALHRTYAEVSSEVAGAPQAFENTEGLQLLDPKLDIQSKKVDLNLGNHVVRLTLVVTAVRQDKTVFLVEVMQSGIFTIRGFEHVMQEQVINVHCAAILYPYASALVSDLVLRSGFMPLHLPPVDFNAIYQQKESEQANQK